MKPRAEACLTRQKIAHRTDKAAAIRQPSHQTIYLNHVRCDTAAEFCLNHCLAMLAAGDKSLTYCAATSRELAVVCSALQALAAQQAPQLAIYAHTAAQICRACEAECRKHPQHTPCVRCAEACDACAAECSKLG